MRREHPRARLPKVRTLGRRRYRARLADLVYPRGWLALRVTTARYVRWRGRLRVIGRAFGGQRVGFKPRPDGSHEVYFGRQLIGHLLAADSGGLRPASWESARPEA